MKFFRSITLTAVSLSTAAAYAAPQSIVLEVPGMTCPTCPITLKKSLMTQPGVTAVAVQYAQKKITVTYDDSRTTLDAILKRTADIGFPSHLSR